MSGGISKDRFYNLEDDHFDCVICQQVVINPKICVFCNNLFCKFCITEWKKKKPFCPFKCNKSSEMQIGDIPASIKNLYESLRVKCSREDCDEVVSLKELVKHEMNCGIAKCFNHTNCGNTAPYTIMDKPVCSEACYIIEILAENMNDGIEISDKELLEHLEKFCEKIHSNVQQSSIKLSWTTNAADVEIQSGTSVVNKGDGGGYKSAVTDQGFVGGIHYFEVECPATNKWPVKIGVTMKKAFDMDGSGFSDFEFGYSFFTKGQLRNSSDSMGMRYGKDMKGKSFVIGVIVNLSRGQIGFMIDGEYQGVAFEDKKLLNGPIFPAVSLRGGCKASLLTGKDLPNEAIFMEM